jgi:catechol 2,3-dioxygenase-like lactoylglutathione lyase family enzyme
MGMIDIYGLHHLRLTVTNLERSKEFYPEVLGFEVAAESPAAPRTWQSAMPRLSSTGCGRWPPARTGSTPNASALTT